MDASKFKHVVGLVGDSSRKKKSHYNDCTIILPKDLQTAILARCKDCQSPPYIQPMATCLTTTDINSQCHLVKQVGVMLQKGTLVNNPDVTLVLQVLSELYLNLETNSILKRSIASALQSIPEIYHPQVIFHLRAGLLSVVGEVHADASDNRAVEVILAALENFPIGSSAVTWLLPEVLHFSRMILANQVEQLQNAVGASQVAHWGLKCQTTMRVIALVLRRNEALLHSTLMKSENDHQGSLVRPSMILLASDVTNLMTTDGCPIDCSSNCGMALTLLIIIITGNIELILEHVFNIHLPNIKRDIADEFKSVAICLKSLLPIPKLSLIMGLLCTLDNRHLTSVYPGLGCSFIYFLLDEIISAETSARNHCMESGVATVTSRVLLLWTQKTREIMKDLRKRDIMEEEDVAIPRCEAIFSLLLEYVWTHWDHFIDSVRHVTKDIFSNVVDLHIIIFNEDAQKSSFVQSLAENAISLAWHCRAKYCALACLVDYLGITELLNMAPSLPIQLLDCMEDPNVASYALELHDKLLYTHKRATLKTQQHTWEQTWVVPVVRAMKDSANPTQIQLILAKLLKRSPELLQFIMSELLHYPSSQARHLAAVMLTAKTARGVGIIHVNHDDSTMWNNILPFHTLIASLLSSDSEVQLGALGLLCDCPKTTELPSRKDIEILQKFLPYLIANHSSAFRQKLLSSMKKLIIRLRDGVQALETAVEQLDSNDVQVIPEVGYFQKFLHWMCDLQFSLLFPSLNFVKRGTALSILKLLQTLVGFHKSETKFSLGNCLTSDNIQTLLECLKDPYENNKAIALSILATLSSEQLGFNDLQRTHDLFECSLHLASRPRPADSVTAAYLLRLLVRHESTREIATKTYRILTDGKLPPVSLSNPSSECPIQSIIAGNVFATIHVLIVLLEKSGAPGSKIVGVSETGLKFGLIVSVRSLLQEVDLGTFRTNDVWKTMLAKLVELCLEIGKGVSPIVNNDSPEGNLPPGIVESWPEDLGTEFPAVVCSDDAVKEGIILSQMLLLCGWRSMKEISLLLGELCYASIVYPLGDATCTQNEFLLSFQHTLEIGDYFVNQLGEMKHRGAFEQTYVGFCKMCDALWRGKPGRLQVLPKQWLTGLFELIRTGEGSSGFCKTRRSAGLPFMVQALVSSEPDVMGTSCFKQSMSDLLQMASNENSSDDTKVHSMNILRALYRDTRLGDDVFQFVADGVMVSIRGFKGKTWAVRNTATLLFSSLVTRIFGVKRSRDEHSRKNSMSEKTFFQRFPSLHQFLLDELIECNKHIDDSSKYEFQPSLYPVLLVLARLYPVGTDSSGFSLSAYIPYVSKSGHSRIMKTRILAAKTIVSIVHGANHLNMVLKLTDALPSNKNLCTNQNNIHGTLLQIRFLLLALANVHKVNPNEHELQISDSLRDKMWIASRANQCNMTRSEFLEIIELSLNQRFIPFDGDFAEEIRKIIHAEFENPETLIVSSPGIADLHCILAKLMLLLDIESLGSSSMQPLVKTLNVLLRHTVYEVRWLTLSYIEFVIAGNDTNTEESPSIPIAEWKFEHFKTAHDDLSKLFASEPIVTLLLQVMSVEEQPDCLTKIYNILSVVNVNPNLDWRINATGEIKTTPIQKLEFILQRGECELRDDVRCALLKLSGNLLPQVYEQIGNQQPCSAAIVMEWADAFSLCSSVQQSMSIRLIAAKILVQNAEILLKDPKRILGSASACVWNAAISLLQDSDLQIRQLTAKIVTVFCPITIHQDFVVQDGNIHSYIALDIIIGCFVQEYCNRNWSECLTMMLDWMLRDPHAAILSPEEESLFDKEDDNCFAETVTFSEILAKHLSTLLEIISKEKCVLANNDEIMTKQLTQSCQMNEVKANFEMCSNRVASRLSQSDERSAKKVLLNDVVEMLLEELILLLNETPRITHQTPFSLPNYDRRMLKLYRYMLATSHICKHHASKSSKLVEIRTCLLDKLGCATYRSRLVQCVFNELEDIGKFHSGVLEN